MVDVGGTFAPFVEIRGGCLPPEWLGPHSKGFGRELQAAVAVFCKLAHLVPLSYVERVLVELHKVHGRLFSRQLEKKLCDIR